MIEKQETEADIVAEMRRDERIHVSIPTVYLAKYADRLEAAWKRERASVGCPPSNVAKMRDALKQAKTALEVAKREMGVDNPIIMEIIDAALAAPPRNCDKYSHDQALRIWSAEPENPMNGCFDDWLYAPATEKGATDGE